MPRSSTERGARWAAANPERRKAIYARYYAAHPGRRVAAAKRWQAKNREKYLAQARERMRLARANGTAWRSTLRRDTLLAYGGKCVRCGFDDPRALQIDHVNGGGATERRALGLDKVLRKQFAAAGNGEYQLLCANCNQIKKHENKEFHKPHLDNEAVWGPRRAGAAAAS